MIRRVKWRASMLLVMALLATAVPGAALSHPQTQKEIENRLEEIQRLRRQLAQREQNVRQDISEADKRRNALTYELQELQAAADSVQARVDEAAAVLRGIQARLDRKTEQLRANEGALEAGLRALRDRAVQVYKHGPASLLDMVVGAEGFGELLRRFSYMVHVVQKDNQQVAQIREIRAGILRERDAIAKLRDRAARQMSAVAHERNHAAAIARSVARERQAAIGELQGGFAQLGDIQRQTEQYERETAELEAESQRISAFLKGHGGGEATVSPRGMIWPASGPVTSGYGWRTHPIFGTRRFHAGIDIGSPSGAPVVSAATGKVVFAGSQTGYGRHVIVDHGGGVATLYGHLASISVGTGAVVVRGGSIGRVGCTGYCTGPHLHFEVRVKGEPDNPMRWLP